MTLEVIESLDGLEKLGSEWQDLWRRCPSATPFQSPQWLLPWTRHVFGGGRIQCLAIREQGELVGFAPFFCWGTERLVVSFLGSGISDYGDLLFLPQHKAGCVEPVAQWLREQVSAGCALDLQEVREGSPLLEGWRAEDCSICPVLDLSTYPASMDSKHRTDVRRARNKLLRAEDVSFEMADAATLPGTMNNFFELHEMRWGPVTPSVRTFHDDVAQAFLETGNLRLAVLRIEGRAAAAIYGFYCGKTLSCYLSGFDSAQAKLSPGAVLLGWLVEKAIEDGLREVDFLRGGEAYKYLWGATDRRSFTVRPLWSSECSG